MRVTRKLTLDLGAVAAAVLAAPDVSAEDLERARKGKELIEAILGESKAPEFDMKAIRDISDETFSAAYGILGGGGESAVLRMASEQISDEAFEGLIARFELLPARPDSSAELAREFI